MTLGLRPIGGPRGRRPRLPAIPGLELCVRDGEAVAVGLPCPDCGRVRTAGVELVDGLLRYGCMACGESWSAPLGEPRRYDDRWTLRRGRR